jgi:hypothetical protein
MRREGPTHTHSTEIAPGSDVVGKYLQLYRFGHQVPPQLPLYNLLPTQLLDFFRGIAGEAAQHLLGVLTFQRRAPGGNG